MHEAQLHEASSFVTLTYAPDQLPADRSVSKRAFQLFMKRLRKAYGAKIRFFAAGEYGDQLERPHYHAILFGVDFPDKQFLKNTPSGKPLYRSATLERLWPYGFASIGTVSFDSARYVAAYCVKKIGGKKAADHYRRIDEKTGEVFDLAPEFALMSRRPGIGYEWFYQYGSDVFPSDEVIMKGQSGKPPRYYDKLQKNADASGFEAIAKKRVDRAATRFDENGPARLRVREEVARSRLNLYKREL